ncbi:phosphatase PAP2 family protein [Arachidicoccus soli]|uniref:Phosphatase PAP2 family protein n=1 Tax=Arachidicoccus soli TaxID=2341117 RepID=A0A386HN61_9BACT|nr:phosphatase PAP2 family protein [Arachidicoccus soli]AYD47056.1 phosphatase PAP2 family protein [Arachidicoccus soli]
MKQDKVLLFFAFLFSFLAANAQVADTALYTRNKADTLVPLHFSYHQLYAPGALIAGGLATFWNKKEGLKNELVEARNDHFANFRTHIDNYLQFSPFLIAYGLDAAGIQSKTDFQNRTAIMIKGEALMLGTVYLLKSSVKELRPDGSAFNSFPSGHTAQAFAAATLLSEEYKNRIKWMPYAAYTLASGVGILRMANNKHYICDVLVGAGIGILSMKVAYWTHQYKWGKKKIIFNPADY